MQVRRLVLTLALLASCAAAAPGVAAGSVPTIVVGDSLAIGTRPFLDPLVPSFSLSWEARNGWTTPQGMRALRAQLREMPDPRAVIISLGSNDGPSAVRFQDRMRRILKRIPDDACVVWPSIVRPARKGDDRGLNRVLKKMAGRDDRLAIVDWQGAVRTGRVRLRDGLHPDEKGYRSRSHMIAATLDRDCDIADTDRASSEPAPTVPGGQGGAAAPGS